MKRFDILPGTVNADGTPVWAGPTDLSPRVPSSLGGTRGLPPCEPSIWERQSVAYQTVNLAPGAFTSQLVEASDPPLGWLMAYAVTVPANDQTVQVGISVNAPGPEGLTSGPVVAGTGSLVNGFITTGPVGQLFIPWPQATVVASTRVGLPGNATWRATYLPVRDPSEANSLGTKVTIENPQSVGAGVGVIVNAPLGATGWSVWPDAANNVTIAGQVTFPGLTTLGTWTIPPAAVPAVADTWLPVSREGGFRLNIFNGAGVAINFNILWEVDLRSWGNPL